MKLKYLNKVHNTKICYIGKKTMIFVAKIFEKEFPWRRVISNNVSKC
jgi:hypothetical protein